MDYAKNRAPSSRWRASGDGKTARTEPLATGYHNSKTLPEARWSRRLVCPVTELRGVTGVSFRSLESEGSQPLAGPVLVCAIVSSPVKIVRVEISTRINPSFRSAAVSRVGLGIALMQGRWQIYEEVGYNSLGAIRAWSEVVSSAVCVRSASQLLALGQEKHCRPTAPSRSHGAITWLPNHNTASSLTAPTWNL
jgi:hypothetical protein